MGMGVKEEGYGHGGKGMGYGRNLCTSLNFIVNLKLL